MADYTEYNDGIGGKGLLVAFLLIGAFIVGLIYLGGSTAQACEIENTQSTMCSSVQVFHAIRFEEGMNICWMCIRGLDFAFMFGVFISPSFSNFCDYCTEFSCLCGSFALVEIAGADILLFNAPFLTWDGSICTQSVRMG